MCLTRIYEFNLSGVHPVVILKHIITSIKFSVAIAGICPKDSYVYRPKHVVILKHIITSIKFSVAIADICLKDSYA
jgi:hypothetical protein